MKIRGNALYYSIIVLLLSSSTTCLILLRSYYRSRILTDTITKKQVRENLMSAFNVLCAGEDLFDSNARVDADIFNDGINIISLNSSTWGAFQVVTARSERNKYSVSETALLGADLSEEEPVALFVPDEGRILSLSGSTLIKGISYLPKKTARKAAIEGFPFERIDITQGDIKASGTNLPAPPKELFDFAYDYLENGFDEQDSIVDLLSLDSHVINNSFTNRTLIILCIKSSDLSYYSFSGRIIIWSSSELILTSETSMTDVILFAPSIKIKNDFTGSFQAYALQSIVVENNCILQYPTILNVIQSEGKYTPGDSLKIILKDHSMVNGGILIRNKGMRAYMKIGADVAVTGQVYVPGYLELAGRVTGSVWCRNFYLQTPGARYENHLLNCTIDRTSLPAYFSGVDISGKNPYRSVIKWLE